MTLMTKRNDNYNKNQKTFHAGINVYMNKFIMYEIFLEGRSMKILFTESHRPFLWELFETPNYNIAIGSYSLN